MKKIFALLLVLCLVLGLCSAAFAAGAPKITKQPVSQETDKNGNVTFTFKARGFTTVSWRFVNPATGEEWAGKELPDMLQVKGFSISVADGRQKVSLKHVPESMNGWDVYAVVSNDSGYSVNTERVKLWFFGMQPDVTATPAPASVPESPAAPAPAGTSSAPAQDNGQAASAQDNGQAASAPAENNEPVVPAGPKMITVTASGLTLCPVDAKGNVLEDQAAASLTFEGSGSVAVRAAFPVKYWTVNGMRIEPAENVTGFILRNVTTDLSISAKEDRASAAEGEVDPDNPCQVTCTGCVFTYNAGGLRSESSGSVPAGAYIIVSAVKGADTSKGYRINGESGHAGLSSFRIQVTEDMEITLP